MQVCDNSVVHCPWRRVAGFTIGLQDLLAPRLLAAHTSMQGRESVKLPASSTVKPCKRTPPDCCMQALQEKGHHVEATSWGAVVQGILADPSDGYLTGVSDPRKDGAPAGS